MACAGPCTKGMTELGAEHRPPKSPLGVSSTTSASCSLCGHSKRRLHKNKKSNKSNKKSAHTLNVELIPKDLITDCSLAIVSSRSNNSYEIFISRVKPILADRNIGNIAWETLNQRLYFTTAQGHTNCPPLQERKSRPS